jgi:hypothetical protein
MAQMRLLYELNLDNHNNVKSVAESQAKPASCLPAKSMAVAMIKPLKLTRCFSCQV